MLSKNQIFIIILLFFWVNYNTISFNELSVKGKLIERWGRKAYRPKAKAKVAGLPRVIFPGLLFTARNNQRKATCPGRGRFFDYQPLQIVNSRGVA